ncbi:hypothetical protein LSCM1_01596 [Leishmania martiniquensis]|uniref:Uncharacterized protein n=1 Tax=Leishmania martiniquensis TaxID=1580590 RepID=A0A836KMS3_9TRYP|nr:hypothetical protein LSCM1_01596 [Leishmania martiniquensis]
MLRPTLFKWVERQQVRLIMERVAQRSARGPPFSHSASHAAAGGASSTLHHTGDMDDFDGAESLDMMDDIPAESFGLRASPPPRRNAHPPEPRPCAATICSRSSGAEFLGSGSGAVEQRDRPRREERPANPARRVITVGRRHHSSPTEAPSASRHAHASAPTASLSSSPCEAPFTEDPQEAPYDEDSEHTAAPVSPAGDGDGASGAAADTSGPGGSKTTTAKSSDAYRFLLHHIDAEIAALQRRHASVTTRRQSVQTRQTQRIKELFELMEHPWTLLPTEVQPALPATGVDVYIKEQQIALQQQNLPHPIPEGQDKMYVLALHKNYKSMPAGRKRFYEEAAHYNAAVREELKFLLTRGCSRFEAFLDSIKECTVEMAREGQVPELPTTHAQNRFNAARGGGSHYRPPSASKALPAGGDASSLRSRKSRQPAGPHPGAATQEGSIGVEAEGEEEEDAEAEEEDDGEVVNLAKEAQRGTRRSSVGLKRGQKASKRIKTAARTAHACAPAADAGGHSSAKVLKGRKGPATSTKKQSGVKPARKGKNSAGSHGGANDRGSSKTASKAAGSATVSRSIPLPNLDHLAIKIKRMMGPSHGSGGAAKKTAKKVSSSLKPAGGRRQKRKK